MSGRPTTVAEAGPAPVHPGSPGERRVAAVGGGLFVVFLAVWLTTARAVPHLLERDWVAFDRAAARVVQGRFAAAYRDSAGEQFPFLYPPYALWLTAPLALVGRVGSYLLVAGTAVGALATTGWGLAALLPQRRASVPAVLAASAVSGAFLLVVITGQNTAVYVAAITVGAVLRRRALDAGAASPAGSRAAGVAGSRSGGAVWGLLIVKPNIAALFLVYLVVRRERRSVEGFVAVTGVALLSTVPMGWAAWRGFADGLAVVGRIMSVTQNWYGQVTVQAAFRVLLDPLGATWAVRPLWLLVGGPLGLWALVVWWRARPVAALDELRLVGTVCLLAVALNPRLYFYDALLLVVPAAAWYLGTGRVGAGTRRVEGTCLSVAFLAGFAEFGALPLSPLVGVAAFGWAAVELRALGRGPAAGGPSSRRPGGPHRSVRPGVTGPSR